MTRDETKKLLERVCRLYITQARKLTTSQRMVMVDTWAEVFADDDYSAIDRAVSSYMRQGRPFMPEPADIMNILNSSAKPREAAPDEATKLFDMMASVSETLATHRRRTSIVDPGGPRWDAERGRYVVCHAELIVSNTSYTQYDFAQLPEEIQIYAEDIDGLRGLWREIQSNRGMAWRRFEAALPQIRADIEERKAKLRKENEERVAATVSRMLDRTRRH